MEGSRHVHEGISGGARRSVDEIVGGRRLRRMRRTPWARDLVRETRLTPGDLIWPLFVMEGTDRAEPVASMPGVERLTIDRVVREAERAARLGIPVIALFPYTDPAKRDPDGTEALNEGNLVCTACRAVKDAVPEIGIMTDVALDPYTSHGHDGLMEGERILNDETVAVLRRQAVLQAEAGSDVIGPSDMMDGRVGAIRDALSDAGLHDTILLSYAAKYASAFYGPFRDAVGSSGTLKGDKRTYQMDPANIAEAIREARADAEEGADMLMVKPGMPYLDVLAAVRRETGLPTAAYQVSGEYAMLHAAAERGWLDLDRVALESLQAFKRAGADAILTYFAPEVAERLWRSP